MKFLGNLIWLLFGGLATATGAALGGVGAGMEMDAMLYSGLGSLAIGGGLITWAFFLDGQVHVDYPTWGLLF